MAVSMLFAGTAGVAGELIQVPSPVQLCAEDPDYRLPHATNDQIEDFFEKSLGFLGDTEDILSFFEPKTVLCVGCSKGIGRANACHWAAREGTERVVSLATTRFLVPVLCPNGGDEKITNVVYDIAKEAESSFFSSVRSFLFGTKLSDILRNAGIEQIDLLLLIAVRDMMGSMRYWKGNELIEGFRNNVAGHHVVWQEVREYLSPDLAVVLGVTSVASETRYFPMRSFYHLTKQALADLILGYAMEEAYEQPNTHYAVLYQGDVSGTFYGIKQILAADAPLLCQAAMRL